MSTPTPSVSADFNLATLLHAQAVAQPHAPALIDYSGGARTVLSFGELAHAGAQAAALLHAKGLTQGDKVLLFHPMSADLYSALAAIFQLGLVALFIDPGMGRAHIDRGCARAQPRGLLATPKAHLLRLISPHVRRIPVAFATGWGAPFATRWARRHTCAPRESIFPAESGTPALATFTSGSTGAPKLAVRTHGFLAHQHAVLEKTLALSPVTGDGPTRILTTLPIFVLSHLAAGLCTVIPRVDIRRPGAVQAAPLLDQIEADQITCLEGSPAFLARLCEEAQRQGRTLPLVRHVFTGGAPVFPTLLDALQRMTPHATVTAVYGSTEAEPIAHIRQDEITPAQRAAMQRGEGLLTGSPVPAIAVRILPDRWGTPLGPYSEQEFAALELPPEHVGEIVVSGDHVLPGYWQGQGDAETKIRVHGAGQNAPTIWHRTGDAGRLDATGQLWLLGRCSARLEDEQGTLYPFAVECAAQAHPAVRQAALVSSRGRRTLAIALHADARGQQEAVEAALRRELAWAGIHTVRVLKTLPVDPRHNAKIDYIALGKLLGD